jgi:hypothetical protein
MCSVEKRVDLFAAALKNFECSLSEQDRREFKSFGDAESMVKAVEEAVVNRADKSRILSTCKKIESFARKWEAFFPVVDIFVSSHPEYAALAWGAVRLVFQVRYNTFLDLFIVRS